MMASDEDLIKNHFLVCKCQSSTHITRFMSCDLDDEMIYIESSLISHKSFLKRFIASMKYLFNFNSDLPHWEESIMDISEAKKLYAYLGDKIK